MSASPAAIAVTIPPGATVATLVLEDCHDACPDTVCDVPSDKAADALNCALSPGFAPDKAPMTATEVTVTAAEAGLVGVFGVKALPPPPQLMNDTVIAAASANAPKNRLMMLSFDFWTQLRPNPRADSAQGALWRYLVIERSVPSDETPMLE